ncbi:ankyrin repeat domain-containing protein [Robertkochia solimangrovi]|uniref:ankyrin repeat domain-containing protein n=1 Tax=Robertkochia solimangrovi TaxID=2213046 RepID=UPI00117DE1B2|nr:ankyrin repeat domain-containing protein [Robertkochia solimangrovi]TRZ41419.1 ankyrin repeat domain-containing protein [Robertkochia solimangrovi]
MKKLALIAALVLSATMTYANSSSETDKIIDPKTTVTAYSVSPFCVAIVKGDLETVKKLIELGADVNAKSKGMTPVMYAAKFNRVEILELLIANGANLKAKDSKLGYTAMDFAELSNANEAKDVLEKALNS